MMLLDVSAPKRDISFFAPIVASVFIASIFLGVEYALRRQFRERFMGIVFDVALVSFVGSLTLLFVFYIVLAILGYAEIRYIFRDLFSVVFLGLILFFSNFAFVLILKTFAHLIRLNRGNSLR